MSIVQIEFGKSSSKNYKKACNLAKKLPNYKQEDNIISCEITEIKEYIQLQNIVLSLVECINHWKNSKITFFDHNCKGFNNPVNLQEFIKSKSGAYSPFIRTRYPIDIAIDNMITYETLPMPVVYYPSQYGAFFGFAESIEGDIYFCECQRKAISNYIELRQQHALCNYSGSKAYALGSDYFPIKVAEMSKNNNEDPLAGFSFKEGLCFRCNKKIPSLKYCLPMYGGQFKQHYGWYIQEKYFSLGIDPLQINQLNVLVDECTPELFDSIKRIAILEQQYLHDVVEDYDELFKARKSFNDIIENSVREDFGYPKIGEFWVSETMLFHILESIYPNEKMIRHYRPKWLEGLELDIFLPNIKMAFEYQGIQHFKPVDHWGGVEQLKKQQEHDRRKAEICEREGIKLVCINYDEDLTSETIKRHIENI